MAKSQSKKQSTTKSLNALRKAAGMKRSAANVETAQPEFKVDAAYVKRTAHLLVETVKHAGDTTRDQIVKLMGQRPETLDALKEKVKAEFKSWLKEEGRHISKQAVWNAQSEMIGAINGYIAYAGMSPSKAKAFEKAHKEAATRYSRLIKFLRDTKRGKANKPNKNAAVERIKSGWKNHKSDMLKKTKDLIRYSDTDSLLVLIDFAEALVKARKQGNVEKMSQRKAA